MRICCCIGLKHHGLSRPVTGYFRSPQPKTGLMLRTKMIYRSPIGSRPSGIRDPNGRRVSYCGPRCAIGSRPDGFRRIGDPLPCCRGTGWCSQPLSCSKPIPETTPEAMFHIGDATSDTGRIGRDSRQGQMVRPML